MDSTAVGGSEGGYNGGLSALASPGAWGGSGSALQQQGRRGTGEEDDRRRSKTERTVGGDGFSMLSKPLLVNGLVLGPGGGGGGGGDQAPPHMLCFSSSPGPEAGSMGRSSRGASLPFFYRSSPAARNTVYGSRSFNGAGASAAARGPFTPSQWLELEHQALIYKYITAKMAVPSNLLGPIKRSVDSAACPSFSGRSLARKWSYFGFCFFMVLNQWLLPVGWGSFYLGADPEPGRCRRTDGKKWRCSRDAVADQKYCERHLNRGRQRSRKPVEHHPARIAAVAIPRPAMEGGAARSSQQPSLSDPSAHLNRFASRKLGDGAGASMASPPVVKEEEETNLLPDLRSEASATDSQTEFGFVPSASLVNPVHGREVAADYRSPIPNPDIGFQPDPTLLSISIPAPSSSARTTAGEPAAYAQPDTIPLSVGGPLGEVLQSTGGSSSGKGPSALNFMSRGDGWDGRGSTTGVLQSAGSGGSSCNDLLVLGSSIVRSSSSSLPLL